MGRKKAGGAIIDPKEQRKEKRSYTVSSKALAQRRGNVALTPARTSEEHEYNSRMIEHMLKINEIALNADRHDLASLKSCFVAYLRLCQEDGFKVGNIAAYASMGMTRQLWDVFSKSDDPERKDFCRMVQMTCALSREVQIGENQLNPVIGIFWQRNFDGLRNDTEQMQVQREMEEDEMGGRSTYKDKYRNMVEDDG